mmetsp:Transcript_16930/g.48269  ORF Transcript_16930/g.48269 Transcript_16930/m.48269 type:complete len:204 (-) Transcript_16930:941-1552(-)
MTRSSRNTLIRVGDVSSGEGVNTTTSPEPNSSWQRAKDSPPDVVREHDASNCNNIESTRAGSASRRSCTLSSTCSASSANNNGKNPTSDGGSCTALLSFETGAEAALCASPSNKLMNASKSVSSSSGYLSLLTMSDDSLRRSTMNCLRLASLPPRCSIFDVGSKGINDAVARCLPRAMRYSWRVLALSTSCTNLFNRDSSYDR